MHCQQFHGSAILISMKGVLGSNERVISSPYICPLKCIQRRLCIHMKASIICVTSVYVTPTKLQYSLPVNSSEWNTLKGEVIFKYMYMYVTVRRFEFIVGQIIFQFKLHGIHQNVINDIFILFTCKPIYQNCTYLIV